MQNKPCWNSKSMGMHLAHNIRILKIKSKKKNFASWLSSVKFTFFSMSFLQQVGVEPSWYYHALRLSICKKLSIRAFCWGIIFFCASNGSVRILKKARDFFFQMMPCIFLITVSFERNIFSSLFLLNCGLFSSQKIVSLLDIFFWYR